MVKATINLGLTCAHAIFDKRCAVITDCTIIAHCHDIHILVPLPIVLAFFFLKFFKGFTLILIILKLVVTAKHD